MTEEKVFNDDDINEMIDEMLKRHSIDKQKLYTNQGKGRPYTVEDFKRIYAIEMSRTPEIYGNDPNSLVDEKVKTFQAYVSNLDTEEARKYFDRQSLNVQKSILFR